MRDGKKIDVIHATWLGNHKECVLVGVCRQMLHVWLCACVWRQTHQYRCNVTWYWRHRHRLCCVVRCSSRVYNVRPPRRSNCACRPTRHCVHAARETRGYFSFSCCCICSHFAFCNMMLCHFVDLLSEFHLVTSWLGICIECLWTLWRYTNAVIIIIFYTLGCKDLEG